MTNEAKTVGIGFAALLFFLGGVILALVGLLKIAVMIFPVAILLLIILLQEQQKEIEDIKAQLEIFEEQLKEYLDKSEQSW